MTFTEKTNHEKNCNIDINWKKKKKKLTPKMKMQKNNKIKTKKRRIKHNRINDCGKKVNMANQRPARLACPEGAGAQLLLVIIIL